MTVSNNLLKLPIAAAVAISFSSSFSFAQDVDGSGELSKKTSNRMLEEVAVTAQKREESIQDVPISIQAFSGEKLDAMGIEEPKALQLVTPGLQYNVFAGYSLIYIRGVGTDAFIPSADASVATYIDNIYYPFAHSLASALGEIKRVEVLKGPQGTLFGRNSTGGAINIITKSPSSESFYASATTTLGRYDKENYRAFVNFPLMENMAVSLSGLSYREEQYYSLAQSSPRNTLQDETSDGYSVKFSWTPGDFSLNLGYSYVNAKGEQSMWLPAQDIKPLGEALGVQAENKYQLGQDAETYVDSDAEVLTSDLQHSTSFFDLRFIAGKQTMMVPRNLWLRLNHMASLRM
jgi:iron complex outermembrane receptor protein